MSLQIRRVVTGHDAEDRGKVEIDEIATNVISNRPGASSRVVWSTKGFPVDNDGFNDPTASTFNTTVDGGTVFRIVRYAPGVTVQRGTIQNWVNRGNEACVIAFVLISSKSVSAVGKSLFAVG